MIDLLKRFRKTDEARGWRGGTTLHIPGLIYRFDARADDAGHIRLLGKSGMLFHHWHRVSPDWAMGRVWHLLGIVTIIHIERGEHLKRSAPAGWRFKFANVSFVRFYRGCGIEFRAADRGYGV